MLAGGRGKAGGVKLASTPEEAGKAAGEILGMEIKGLLVKQVLVEEQLAIAQEFYAGLIINSAQEVRGPVLMFSPEGGMDIESVPEDKIATNNVDVIKGLMIHDTLDMVVSMGIEGPRIRPLAAVILKLYECFARMTAGRSKSIHWFSPRTVRCLPLTVEWRLMTRRFSGILSLALRSAASFSKSRPNLN